MQRIALWNTAFLGDAVLTLPLALSLKERYPQAAIDFYVRKGVESLFTPHPVFASVYAFDKRGEQKGVGGMTALARQAASRSYDLWISAHTSMRSGAVALASRAPMRIGYASSALGALWYTHLVDRRFDELDEIERLLMLLDPLGNGPVAGWPEIVLNPIALERAKAFFSALPMGPVAGLHPGSVWPTKRWPAAGFAEIGCRVIREGGSVLLFAGPGEEAIAAEVSKRILDNAGPRAKERLFDVSGALDLQELAAYLSLLSVYVTNDSGPMHLAWAQRVPVTAIFGPTVKKLGFFPRGKDSQVFEVTLSCRPCGLHGPVECPQKHHRCMSEITPDIVWPDVRQKLMRGF